MERYVDPKLKDRNWMIGWLDRKFGHEDFIRLKRDIKFKRYAEVVDEIQRMAGLARKQNQVNNKGARSY